MERRTLVDRLKSIDSRVFDGLLTLGVTLFGVGSQFVDNPANDPSLKETDALALLLGLATCLPLYLRRRQPLPALTASAVAITVLAVSEYATNNLPNATLFLAYAVGAFAPRRQAIVGLGVVVLAIVTIWLSDTPDLDTNGMILNIALFSAAWLAGQVVRARSLTAAAQLAEAEKRAEAENQAAARAVAEERLRIAQELHDVVAHSMSVIAVQAGMGAHVLDSQPEEARRALENISQTSRTTLNEMRRLLGVLRDEEGERSHAPAPGLDEVPHLVDDVRRAGLPVELDIAGPSEAVPHGVELSVYRLVQESLTNIIKHAGTASATVTISCTPVDVDVEVVDDGRGAAVKNGHGGHGLVGMRERVAVWGGTLDAGPRVGGGFRIHARIPFGDAS